MIATVDLTGVALVITAIATPIVVIITAYWNRAATRQVRDEVRTYNEKTMGELAAEGETRRATAITHDDRTAQEQRHIDQAPEPDPPQGASR